MVYGRNLDRCDALKLDLLQALRNGLKGDRPKPEWGVTVTVASIVMNVQLDQGNRNSRYARRNRNAAIELLVDTA